MTDLGPYAVIPLTRGKVTMVSAHREATLKKFTWRAVQHKRSWYAKATIIKGDKRIDLSMHRFIAQTPPGMVCHHINRNSLDNRDENLRNMSKEKHDTECRNNGILVKFESTPTITSL